MNILMRRNACDYINQLNRLLSLVYLFFSLRNELEFKTLVNKKLDKIQ